MEKPLQQRIFPWRKQLKKSTHNKVSPNQHHYFQTLTIPMSAQTDQPITEQQKKEQNNTQI